MTITLDLPYDKAMPAVKQDLLGYVAHGLALRTLDEHLPAARSTTTPTPRAA